MTQPLYAVGDIHGQIDFLEQALAWIAADGGDAAEVVFVGDLEDRGPDSRAVIERLRSGIAEGRPWTVLKGNHDRMFTRYLDSGELHDERIASGIGWLNPRLGGPMTLASYGVMDAESRPFDIVLEEARRAVPPEHRAFLKALPVHHQRGELLFVHAGIRPEIALEDQTEDDMIWIRDGFLKDNRAHPWLVVHGHTAIDVPAHYGNRVNIDGGAGYGRTLYPVVFEGRDAWMLDETGRIALAP